MLLRPGYGSCSVGAELRKGNRLRKGRQARKQTQSEQVKSTLRLPGDASDPVFRTRVFIVVILY